MTAELTKVVGRTVRSNVNKLINFISIKEELPEERKESIIVPIYRRAIKQTVVIPEAYHIRQLRISSYSTSCRQG